MATGLAGAKFPDFGVELRCFLRVFRIRIVTENLNGFSQLTDRRYLIALCLVDVGQKFKERNAAGAGDQVFLQEGFGKPVVLAFDGFGGEGLKGLPGRHQASEAKVEGRKEPAGFRVVRIQFEKLFERRRAPGILAGVHLCDGLFEQCALLAIADNTRLVRASSGFLESAF
jgi:hypothetical protein